MRLFVALDITEDIRSALAALVTNLRATTQKARWTRIEGVHVTLKFIGEVPPEKADAIKSVLDRVQFPNPITLHFRDLGFFPNDRRPRVLWAGVRAGAEASSDLAALASAVEAVLVPLGVAPEQRAFSPHLTLARFESPVGLDRLHAAIETAGPLEFGSMTARNFHLYQSVLKRGGAEYTRLATFPMTRSQSE